MQLKPMRVGNIKLYAPKLGSDPSAITGVQPVTDLSAAIADSMQRQSDFELAVIPEGPYVVPFV